MTKALAPLLLLALLASGCQPKTKPPVVAAEPAPPEVPGWRGEALPEDVVRIENTRASWNRALNLAREKGFRRQVEAEGKLLDPDAGLPFPAPAPGSYMCRALKFDPGARRFFTAYKPFFCFVGADQDKLFLTKQTGTERPNGYLWEGRDPKTLVFLGSMALGAEDATIPYGSDRSRDLAGIFERIGPLRFRLVIPRDVAKGRLDIFELLPAPIQNEE